MTKRVKSEEGDILEDVIVIGTLKNDIYVNRGKLSQSELTLLRDTLEEGFLDLDDRLRIVSDDPESAVSLILRKIYTYREGEEAPSPGGRSKWYESYDEGEEFEPVPPQESIFGPGHTIIWHIRK